MREDMLFEKLENKANWIIDKSKQEWMKDKEWKDRKDRKDREDWEDRKNRNNRKDRGSISKKFRVDLFIFCQDRSWDRSFKDRLNSVGE